MPVCILAGLPAVGLCKNDISVTEVTFNHYVPSGSLIYEFCASIPEEEEVSDFSASYFW